VSGPGAAQGACIDEDAAVAFVQGRLPSDAIEALEEHLDRCPACRFLIADLTTAAITSPVAAATDGRGPATFAPGTRLAERYRIVRLLARGGMGEVYEAEDQELQSRIALKSIAASISDDAVAIRRLKAEVQLARKVSHPNVCRIFDLGVDRRPGPGGETTSWFLTMELLAGDSLGRHIRTRGRIPPPEALSLACQMARGLSAAHRVGVIHRDFKSDNVMVVPSLEHGLVAMITDFGLARETTEARPGSLVTSADAVVGTVAYMAPEQVEGKPATAASDLYALGVVLFEMLTGDLPFTGGSPMVVAARRLREEPPTLRSRVPTLSRQWDELVLRCLARAPARRYRSADEVAAALAAIGSGAKGAALHPTWRPGRRVLVGAVGTAILTATGLSLLGRRPVGRQGVARPPAPASPPVSPLPIVPAHVEAVPNPATISVDRVAPRPPAPRPRPRRRAPFAPVPAQAERPRYYEGVINPFK
jgi:tRNA A-37 threonylcarbamoyl transferase component Bud32